MKSLFVWTLIWWNGAAYSNPVVIEGFRSEAACTSQLDKMMNDWDPSSYGNCFLVQAK